IFFPAANRSASREASAQVSLGESGTLRSSTGWETNSSPWARPRSPSFRSDFLPRGKPVREPGGQRPGVPGGVRDVAVEHRVGDEFQPVGAAPLALLPI